MAVTITQGTQTNIKTTTDSGAEIQHTRVDGGTVGVLSSVSNLVKGTITALAAGTITGGTLQNLNFGTVDTYYRHPDRFATVVSSGTNTMGTVKAGIAGSAIYVTDLIVSAGSATNVEIGNGGTNLPLIGTLHLSANGGAVMNFTTPISTSAGSALVYKQSTAVSPLSITCLGYVD